MISEIQAKKFCKEDISKIENYDKAISDTTQIWHCHHRTEIWWNCSKKELIENECYYNRKACELIFLSPAEHIRLHKKDKKRKPFSKKSRRKMSKSHIGKVPWNKDKKNIYSENTRIKISESLKGHPPTKGTTGMHWYNNGIDNVLSYTCPEGYVKGRLK